MSTRSIITTIFHTLLVMSLTMVALSNLTLLRPAASEPAAATPTTRSCMVSSLHDDTTTVTCGAEEFTYVGGELFLLGGKVRATINTNGEVLPESVSPRDSSVVRLDSIKEHSMYV